MQQTYDVEIHTHCFVKVVNASTETFTDDALYLPTDVYGVFLKITPAKDENNVSENIASD